MEPSTDNTAPPGWSLVFSDEFDQATVDSKVWTATIDGRGGGNEEAQYYSADAVTIAPSTTSPSGFKGLQLTATPIVNAEGTNISDLAHYSSPNLGSSHPTQRWYKSGKVVSRGHQSFQYGRVDVRAKLPAGDHLWPAIWMLPDSQTGQTPATTWPNGGELDIAEAFGIHRVQDGGNKRISGAVHWGTDMKSHVMATTSTQLLSGEFSDAFHVFSVVWEPSAIHWYLDGTCYGTITPHTRDPNGLNPHPRPPWPFGVKEEDTGNPFHLLINLAVGGTCGGLDVPPLDHPGTLQQRATAVNYTSRPPQVLTIDYVRVYKQITTVGAGGPYLSLDTPLPEPLPPPGKGNHNYHGTGYESVTARATTPAPPTGPFQMSVDFNNAAPRYLHVDLLRTSDWANVAFVPPVLASPGVGTVHFSIDLKGVAADSAYVWSVWTVSAVDQRAAQPWLYKHAWQMYHAQITQTT